MLAISDILKIGESLSYAYYINGKSFAHHWAVYKGKVATESDRNSQLEQLLFLSEAEPAKAGLGGPKVRVRSQLTCRPDFYPSFYRVVTSHSVNVLSVSDQVKITLPDGSEYRSSDTNFRCLVGENLCQLALFLKLVGAELGDDFSAQLFSLDSAAVFAYTLKRMEKPEECDGRWYSSSLLEEFCVGKDGWISKYLIPKQGVVAIRETAPLPDWIDESLIEKPLAYVQPEGAQFTMEDVQVPGPVVSIGTSVTKPKTGDRHPVALFISGSGSHDRHGIAGKVDIGTHEIADYISEHGWLCARSDTRGTGQTKLGSDFLEMGVDEIVEDSKAVLKYLLNRSDADSNHVALIGHSQGGLLALELALSEPAVTRVVVLAMAGRSLVEVLRDQILVGAAWVGQTEAQVEAQIKELEEFVELVRTQKEWTKDSVPAKFYLAQRQRKWYADHLRRNPLELIKRITCPILICQGAKDFQVSVDKDAKLLYETALNAGVRVELAVFNDLDHLFKPVEGEAHVSQYYDVDRRVSDNLKKRVIDFLNEDLIPKSPEN